MTTTLVVVPTPSVIFRSPSTLPGVAATITPGYSINFSATLTANRTYTLADANMTLAGVNYAQSWSALQSFPDNLLNIVGSSDATKKVVFEVDGLTTATTRTVTAMNASGTMALSSGALTSTRVPFANSSGVLADNSGLLYSTAVTGYSAQPGRIVLGTGAAGTDDCAILATRTFGAGGADSHSFRDESAIVSPAGYAGFCPFDAKSAYSGTTVHANSHWHGFQARPDISISGTLPTVTGLYVFANHTGAGTVTDNRGVMILNPNGSGTITNNIGIDIASLTRGSVLNYAIRTGGTTPSLFGGACTFSSGITSTTLLTTGTNVFRNDGADTLNYFDSYNSVGSSTSAFNTGRRARGSLASPTACLAGDWLVSFAGTGHNGSSMLTAVKAIFGAITSELWSGTANGTHLVFYTCAPTTTAIGERMRITDTGNLLLGTTTDLPSGSSGGLSTTGARSIKVRPIVSAAGTTVLDGDDHFVCLTGSTTQTFTLPAAVTGRQLIIKNRSSGAGTINRAGSDTIDGLTTLNLAAGTSVTLIANSTDWTVN